jgi:hypothetical protein
VRHHGNGIVRWQAMSHDLATCDKREPSIADQQRPSKDEQSRAQDGDEDDKETVLLEDVPQTNPAIAYGRSLHHAIVCAVSDGGSADLRLIAGEVVTAVLSASVEQMADVRLPQRAA